MPDVKKLTITRKQWLRGTGQGVLLHTLSGKMCCLGFCALQIFDSTQEQIRGLALPYEFGEWSFGNSIWEEVFSSAGPLAELDKNPKAFDYIDEIAQVNDSTELSGDERETELTKLFLDIGVEVEFID